MTRRCFFVGRVEADAEYVTLTDQTAHHIESVLRSRRGDVVELRDGCGNGWRGIIDEVSGERIRVQLVEKQSLASESPLQLTLALALSRSDRMDMVLRQATELGISRFVAFRAQRSQYGLSGAQVEKRRDRWMKIAREALCQCGRTTLPEILILANASELIDRATLWGGSQGGLKILVAEEGCREDLLSLWRSFPTCERILAVVGPEGGWEASEIAQFTGAGFQNIHLGPRILRFETAGIVFPALAQLLWGDWGEGRFIKDYGDEMP